MKQRCAVGVLPHRRRNNLALRQSGPIVNGDDADDIVRIFNYDRFKPIALRDDARHLLEQRFIIGFQADRIATIHGEHNKLREVNGIAAFTQNFALRAFLAAILKECANILKITGSFVRRQCLCSWQRCAIARKHVADLPLRDRNQRHPMYPILERHKHMKAAAQYIGLETRFVFEGN